MPGFHVIHAGSIPFTWRQHRRAVVVTSVPVGRPAIVATRLEDLDLVAADRPELGVKDLPGGRMHRDAVVVAMTDGEDFRPAPRFADEWIVGRHGAVIFQAQHLAENRIRRLRGRQAGSASDRDVDQPVVGEDQARTPRRHRIAGVELLYVRQPGALVAATSERQRPGVALERLVVGEVDQAVLGELRVQRHVEHPGWPTQVHLRQAGQRYRIQLVLPNRKHLAGGAHAHQNVAIGQRQEGPRARDAMGDHRDLDLLIGRLVHAAARLTTETAARSGRQRAAPRRPRSPG